MILKGNQRANGAELAIHLMKAENEHVELQELRGFISDTLKGAFQEVEAISRATRCEKYLYSLSLNPPANENASVEAFEEAIEKAEALLGLSGQPRAVVFHTKEGRTHCHVVWSRIDVERFKAIKLTFPKRKLKGLAFDLFLQNGWEVPAGFFNDQEADPMNYSYAEYQEAKRGDWNPKHLKARIKQCWASSDGRKSFEAALERNGLFLAQGDRRGYVCVDYEGNVYSLSRWTGAKNKELSAQLGETEYLRTVDETRSLVAERMTPKLKEYVEEVTAEAKQDLSAFRAQNKAMVERQRSERQSLQKQQTERWNNEVTERAGRFSNGLKGLWHRINGRHKQIMLENQLDAQRCLQRDAAEQKELKDRQSQYRRQLQDHINTARSESEEQLDILYSQLSDYDAMVVEIGQQKSQSPTETKLIQRRTKHHELEQ